MRQLDMTAIVSKQQESEHHEPKWRVHAEDDTPEFGHRIFSVLFATHPHLNAREAAIEYARLKFRTVEVRE